MRLLLFYDLPVGTAQERKNANNFRKMLVTEGFIMLQESVYCKLVLNKTVLESVEKRMQHSLPKNGNIIMLIITEKQFSNIKYLCGERDCDYIDSDKRVLII